LIISAISSNCVVVSWTCLPSTSISPPPPPVVHPERHHGEADVGALFLVRVDRERRRLRVDRRRPIERPDRRGHRAAEPRRRQARDVLDEVERDVAEPQALAFLDCDRGGDQLVVLERPVGRAEVAHRPLVVVERQVRVVARDRRLEDREALAIDLAADEGPRIQAMRTAPDVDQRGHRRPRTVQLDLLGHDLDRARKLITTLFAQHPDFSGTLATHRAHHRTSLSLRDSARSRTTDHWASRLEVS
jgi:hypothetical protein